MTFRTFVPRSGGYDLAMRSFASPTRATATKTAPPVRRQLRHPLPAQRAAARTTSGAPARGGLPDRLKAGVEGLSGLAMDDVRVHRSSPEPAKLDALAFTRGSDIHLGPGQEEHLPHEAWHVVQQKQGRVTATTQMKGVGINEDARLEAEADSNGIRAADFARQAPTHERAVASPPPIRRDAQAAAVAQCQRKPGPIATGRERVMGRADVAKRSRTVVRIEVVGHASPRWRSAKSPQQADEMNWRLAETRARQVRLETEKLLKDLLPNRSLVFEYRFRPSTEKPSDAPVRALDEPTDVALDFQGRGSKETLGEAGRRGRAANDDPMRRVEVKVTMHSQNETDVEEDIERSVRKPGATRDWSIWVTGEAGVELVGKAGGILIQLRNGKTGNIGTYAGWTSGAGVSVGVNIAKTSRPNFESFTTPEPMTFADFSGSNFSIASVGVGVGFFGAEWSKFRFSRFGGGQPTPGGIQVGGLSIGGIGLNLGSAVYGAMFLADNPLESYTEISRVKHTQTFESLSLESASHRVFFETGSSEVNSWESDGLNAYLFAIVTRSGL